jgi:hypothetical protein
MGRSCRALIVGQSRMAVTFMLHFVTGVVVGNGRRGDTRNPRRRYNQRQQETRGQSAPTGQSHSAKSILIIAVTQETWLYLRFLLVGVAYFCYDLSMVRKAMLVMA